LERLTLSSAATARNNSIIANMIPTDKWLDFTQLSRKLWEQGVEDAQTPEAEAYAQGQVDAYKAMEQVILEVDKE